MLSDTIWKMFEDNVAQVKVLQNIKGQIMTRKQRVEKIMWETLQDVIYLRNRDGGIEKGAAGNNIEGGDEGEDETNTLK